ncbi:hypothetical protein Areg01_11360 [Actinoplanes regularis]|nr:hypothetical protein Areg01_11360 [Actinoplanes regularis]
MMAAAERIEARVREDREDHLEMLDTLLGLILGDRADRTFTAADLRALGVDPEPPSTDDYELYDA